MLENRINRIDGYKVCDIQAHDHGLLYNEKKGNDEANDASREFRKTM